MNANEAYAHKRRMLDHCEQIRRRNEEIDGLLSRLYAYLAMMASHQRERTGAKLLIEATAVIEELRQRPTPPPPPSKGGGGEETCH